MVAGTATAGDRANRSIAQHETNVDRKKDRMLAGGAIGKGPIPTYLFCRTSVAAHMSRGPFHAHARRVFPRNFLGIFLHFSPRTLLEALEMTHPEKVCTYREAGRLSFHIADRLKDLRAFRRPERRVAEVLRSRNPDDLANTIISAVCDCVANEADWHQTTEALARALDLDNPDRVERIRAGNVALNFCVEGLPDLFALDPDTHSPLIVCGAKLPPCPSILEPSTEPPGPWTGDITGGRPENRKAVEDAFAAGTMWQHVDGVNALRAVPFIINEAVLDAVRWFYAHGSKIEGIPGQVPTSKNAWWQAKLNARYGSLRTRFERDIDTAERKIGADFYIQNICDWRGRVYGIPDFRFDREDRVRALFLFARPKPIGEQGLFWLKVYVASCGDFDGIGKRTFEERAAWCDDRPNVIRMIARHPCDRASRSWLAKADKPFAFLAACIELVAAWDAGPEYETRLPVLFDASSSGLQHYCLMMCGAKAWRVNLADMPPQDIYQAVADEALVEVKDDAVHAASERKPRPLSEREDDFDDEGDKGFEKAKSAEALLTGKLTRKTAKPNVMTKVYGATAHGRTDQNFEQLKEWEWITERIDLLKRSMGEHRWAKFAERIAYRELGAQARYLAELTDQALQRLIPEAYEAMRFLGSDLPAGQMGLVQVLLKEHKPLSWTTPSGFPWINCYREHDTRRPRFLIMGKKVQKKIAVGYKQALRPQKTANAVAANFVHALDSSHLMLTINAAVAAGIVDIVAVHDCIGTHACEGERLRQIILEEFVRMYETHDVLAEVKVAAQAVTNLPLPDLPQAGPFDLSETLKARYAFQP